jgi:FixJ family two-component response regulator
MIFPIPCEGVRVHSDPASPVPRIRVVDDDPAVRASIERLLLASGLAVSTFASAKALLNEDAPEQPGCVVLDLALCGESGLELQRRLADERPLPIVFISGCGDVPASVCAMKAGALDFLTKPFEAETLIRAVRAAIRQDGAMRAVRADQQMVAQRLATLTPRERQVLEHMIEGKLNKQIAAELGTAEKTVKVHRARVLHKMAVRSVAVLGRMIERAGARVRNR